MNFIIGYENISIQSEEDAQKKKRYEEENRNRSRNYL